MDDRSHIALSWIAGVFGSLLGLQAVWLLGAELIRPDLPYFPGDRSAAEAAAALREPAAAAATIAMFRGEVSADYAITMAADLIAELEGGPAASPETLELINTATEQAASLAPHDARMWLLLALARARLNRDVNAPLKLAYYTAPNELPLIPLRLFVSASSGAMRDPELQNLAQREMRLILTGKPELKPAILRAHGRAPADVKGLIEATVAGLDANFATTLRAGRVN